ncbi:MAG: hypothetical protein OEY59_00220 [Deltaproteobacteria bacterium]|nr:hypothetical protein [Deltaproteobacteria bacterium]
MHELGPFDIPDATESYYYDIDPRISAKKVMLPVLSSMGGNIGAKEIEFFIRHLKTKRILMALIN